MLSNESDMYETSMVSSEYHVKLLQDATLLKIFPWGFASPIERLPAETPKACQDHSNSLTLGGHVQHDSLLFH